MRDLDGFLAAGRAAVRPKMRLNQALTAGLRRIFLFSGLLSAGARRTIKCNIFKPLPNVKKSFTFKGQFFLRLHLGQFIAQGCYKLIHRFPIF